jgi:hypothetical protein
LFYRKDHRVRTAILEKYDYKSKGNASAEVGAALFFMVFIPIGKDGAHPSTRFPAGEAGACKKKTARGAVS